MAGKLIAHLVAWYMPDKSPGGGGLENLTVDECADTICRAFGEAEGK